METLEQRGHLTSPQAVQKGCARLKAKPVDPPELQRLPVHANNLAVDRGK